MKRWLAWAGCTTLACIPFALWLSWVTDYLPMWQVAVGYFVVRFTAELFAYIDARIGGPVRRQREA